MNYIFILSSVTYALKGKNILDKNGIKSNLIKSSNLKELRGCGYGLKVEDKDKEAAYELFQNFEIKISDIIGEEQ